MREHRLLPAGEIDAIVLRVCIIDPTRKNDVLAIMEMNEGRVNTAHHYGIHQTGVNNVEDAQLVQDPLHLARLFRSIYYGMNNLCVPAEMAQYLNASETLALFHGATKIKSYEQRHIALSPQDPLFVLDEVMRDGMTSPAIRASMQRIDNRVFHLERDFPRVERNRKTREKENTAAQNHHCISFLVRMACLSDDANQQFMASFSAPRKYSNHELSDGYSFTDPAINDPQNPGNLHSREARNIYKRAIWERITFSPPSDPAVLGRGLPGPAKYIQGTLF
ncbi:hypothetical protein J4460_07140 [Candidatus Woesearchaeota archaeon]|nr:MAG: hypothetical protein QS99_C0019G0028 [archaeon GW2011_AR4]MBS3130415.1 hypothetical protein [Candidatus Woesearchaeota archaeon]HIH38678.1 hypothetical protein [Candidatus Woesearchaeota archaeon]HIH49612.1 hypothetical protein [Candidatus Woesearchaeota archaeon]HIJ03528.1 hypothetical protein [Candidatus Woesearchaeota archaeon]